MAIYFMILLDNIIYLELVIMIPGRLALMISCHLFSKETIPHCLGLWTKNPKQSRWVDGKLILQIIWTINKITSIANGEHLAKLSIFIDCKLFYEMLLRNYLHAPHSTDREQNKHPPPTPNPTQIILEIIKNV